MSTLDTLVQRNHEFAAHRFVAGLPMRPSLHTLIISCADPRVDPVHLLGLEPGEAGVLRHLGARLTPGTLQLLSMLLQVPTGAHTPSPGAPPAPPAHPPFPPISLPPTHSRLHH